MKRVHGVIKIARVLTLIGVFSLLANSQSKAQLLTLQPVQVGGLPAPDFNANVLTVSYTAASGETPGVFQVTGDYLVGGNQNWVDNYTDAEGNFDLASGGYTFAAAFNMTAYITSAGSLTSGSLSIAGDLTGNNGPEVSLLTGTLTTGAEGVAFGAVQPPGETDAPFQFLFTVTGGSLSSDYGGVGSADGYVNYLWPDGGYFFSGSWTTGFANSGNGYADIQIVPEPSSFLLLIFAGALWAAASIFRRSSRRAQ